MTKTVSSQASRWVQVSAGFYRHTGSDGQAILAEISHDEDGTWSYLVRPFGEVRSGWAATGHRTLAEAQRMAEAVYRSYMSQHAAMNTPSK